MNIITVLAIEINIAIVTALDMKTDMAGNILRASIIDTQPKKSVQLPVEKGKSTYI